jgi:eukaryotic-like serine/threonine-protein kinase
MYHLLTGRPPFEAEDALALAYLHLHETPMPLDRARGASDLPESLIAIVSRLMCKSPKDRFQSPRELLDLIRGENAGASFTNVGTAAATIRLQRMTQEENQRRRRQRYRWAAAILLPLMIGAGTAFAIARRTPLTVERLLIPETVHKAESVEAQYLNAVRRNDPAGWRAVFEYFPPNESATNAEYYAKSSLQLARCLKNTKGVNESELREADNVLERLLSNPQVDRLYLALALTQRCEIQEALGGGSALSQSLARLRSVYVELKANNPADADVFDGLVPTRERTKLQLDLTSSS